MVAQIFYRPRRRVRPGAKRGKPLDGFQLALFPDETQVPTAPRDPRRPLLDLFPDAYR